MSSIWKKAALMIGALAVCGAVITWQVHEHKLTEARRDCFLRAEQGNAEAEYELGIMYSHGRGLPLNFAEALRWYRKSAEQGYSGGQTGLGDLYFRGKGLPQDYAEAIRWYQKASDQGFPRAQYNLGYMYYQGFGAQQSYAEAIRWYRKAAEQGQANAQNNLAGMYYYGYGVPQDRAEADRWYHQAADQGYENAQRVLGFKGEKLTTFSIIIHLATFLGCFFLLIRKQSHGWRLQNRQQYAISLAALLGLTVEGLDLYWVFGAFSSLSAVNAFFFTKNLLAGIFIALLIILLLPRTAKTAFGIISTLFVFLDLLLLFAHSHSMSPISVRAFCSLNGMFFGITIPLAISLWRKYLRDRNNQTGNSKTKDSESTVEGGEELSNSLQNDLL